MDGGSVTGNQQTCPSCGALSSDGLLCVRETNALMRNLAELPGLLRELQTTLTRQNNSATGNNGSKKVKGATRPLPFDNNASEVGDVVSNTLSTWVRELFLDDDYPADNSRACANWLLRRIERIRRHEAAPEIADEVDHCVRSIRRAIDNRAERLYLGPCQNFVDGKPCATQLYAPAHAEAYDCPNEACDAIVKVPERRKELLALVEDSSATMSTCTQVLGRFGLDVKLSTVQKWSKPTEGKDGIVYPPKLWNAGKDDNGHLLYRVGDIQALAEEAMQRRSSRKRAS